MKTKIEIKNVYGSILFEYEKENNSIKETLAEAINAQVDLRWANLRDAYLCGADLRGANFFGADLSGANLNDANLRDAYLCGADLSCANLNDANLRDADLSGANLNDANLRDADLRDTNLSWANLIRAYLCGADLRGANFFGANLSGANLNDAYFGGVDANENTCMYFSQCPSEGSFIGWKKAEGFIVKLLITEDAIRSSATSLKCRCSKAKVLEIQKLDGSKSNLSSVLSSYDRNFIYKVGEVVEVKDFDKNRWNECSSGIHFFISREMASIYY